MSKLILVFLALSILSCNSNSNVNNDIDSSLMKDKVSISNEQLPNSLDSLKKYSYFFYGKVTENLWEQGSGFFIRVNKKLYFTSALHSFTGMTIDHKKIPNYPDTLRIRINSPENKRVLYKIGISSIKKNTKDIPFYLRADAYAYSVNIADIPKNVTIYSIENFINPFINCNEVKQAIICGYPNLHTNDTNITMTAFPVLSRETIFGNYCQKMYYSSFNSYDTINYSISAHVETDGYSGSPVFVIYRNKIFFGGLLSSGNAIEKMAVIVRPEYVLDKLH
jgi:hypothetical protein